MQPLQPPSTQSQQPHHSNRGSLPQAATNSTAPAPSRPPWSLGLVSSVPLPNPNFNIHGNYTVKPLLLDLLRTVPGVDQYQFMFKYADVSIFTLKR